MRLPAPGLSVLFWNVVIISKVWSPNIFSLSDDEVVACTLYIRDCIMEAHRGVSDGSCLDMRRIAVMLFVGCGSEMCTGLFGMRQGRHKFRVL